MSSKRLEMTRREFQVLRVLASRPGEVISRSELLGQVWVLDDRVSPLQPKR